MAAAVDLGVYHYLKGRRQTAATQTEYELSPSHMHCRAECSTPLSPVAPRFLCIHRSGRGRAEPQCNLRRVPMISGFASVSGEEPRVRSLLYSRVLCSSLLYVGTKVLAPTTAPAAAPRDYVQTSPVDLRVPILQRERAGSCHPCRMPTWKKSPPPPPPPPIKPTPPHYPRYIRSPAQPSVAPHTSISLPFLLPSVDTPGEFDTKESPKMSNQLIAVDTVCDLGETT